MISAYARINGQFPGNPERISGNEMRRIYSLLDEETHILVARLLVEATSPIVRVVHDYIDTPTLAIRALELGTGRTLPLYEGRDLKGREVEVGQTRVIETTDRFRLQRDPYMGYGTRFLTYLERAA